MMMMMKDCRSVWTRKNDNKQQVEWKQEEKKKRTGGVKTGWIAHILMSLFLISAKGNNACH